MTPSSSALQNQEEISRIFVSKYYTSELPFLEKLIPKLSKMISLSESFWLT